MSVTCNFPSIDAILSGNCVLLARYQLQPLASEITLKCTTTLCFMHRHASRRPMPISRSIFHHQHDAGRQECAPPMRSAAVTAVEANILRVTVPPDYNRAFSSTIMCLSTNPHGYRHLMNNDIEMARADCRSITPANHA